MDNKAEKVSSLRAKLAARRQALDGEASALLSPEAASDFGGRSQSSKRVVFTGLDSFSEPEATNGSHLPRSLYRGTDSAVNAHELTSAYEHAPNASESRGFEQVSRQHQVIHEATLDADARLRNAAFKENELRGIVSLIERKEAELVQKENKVMSQKQELQGTTNQLTKKSRELAERDNQLRINYDLMVSREDDLKKFEKTLKGTEQVLNQQASRMEQLEQDLASKLELLYQREANVTTFEVEQQKLQKQLAQQAAENDAELHRLKKYDSEVLMLKQDLQKQKLAFEARELEFNRAVAEDSALMRGLKEFEDNLKHKESNLEIRIKAYHQNVSELETKERQLNSREQDLTTESTHLASQLKATKKREAELAHEISQTREENNSIQQQKNELSKREFQLVEAEKQVQLKSKRVAAAEKELEDRLLDIERLEETVAEQDARIAEERQAVKLQRKQLADVEAMLQKMQAQIESDQNQLVLKAAEINEKETQFQQVMVSYQKEKQRIETFANESAAFAESLEEAKMELEQCRQEQEASFQIARKQQDILDQRERNLIGREKKVREDESNIETMEQRIQSSMEEIKTENVKLAANHKLMQEERSKIQSLERNLQQKERELSQKEIAMQQTENRLNSFQASLEESHARLTTLNEEKENVELLTRNLEVQRHEMQLVRTKLKEYESEMEQTITDMDNQQLRIDDQKAELDIAVKRAAEVERETASLRAREEVVRKNQLKYQELIDQAQEMINNTSAREAILKSRTEEIEASQRQLIEKERATRLNESQVEALMKKLQSEQDRLLVQETEIEEYASQLDKTRDTLLSKEEWLRDESQKMESRKSSAEKMIRESLEKLKQNQELESKLQQEKATFEEEKRFIQDHIQSIESKEVEIEAKFQKLRAKETALEHQQNVEFRKRMEYLDHEFQTKAAALDERISAVYEFDLSHVEKVSRQESKIAALEQEVQTLQQAILEKDAQIDKLNELRPDQLGKKELSVVQPSRFASLITAKQPEGLRSNFLREIGQPDVAVDGSSKVAPKLLPEIQLSSEKDVEPSAAQQTVQNHAQASIGLSAVVAAEPRSLDAPSRLEGPVVHRASMHSTTSGLSAASFRNRDFPSLSQSNMFLTPQSSRVLDQHSKPLSYSLQKHAPEVSASFASTMPSLASAGHGYSRMQLPSETLQESSKSAAFSAEVNEMQRKIGRRLDALRESRLQKSEGKF